MPTYYDIESGAPMEVSQGFLDNLAKAYEMVRPKQTALYKGRPIVFGTGGDLEAGNLEDVFYNPEQYQMLAGIDSFNYDGKNLSAIQTCFIPNYRQK